MKEKLGDGEWISVDTEDEMVVNFYYPQIFEAEYLRSCVRLEIIYMMCIIWAIHG